MPSSLDLSIRALHCNMDGPVQQGAGAKSHSAFISWYTLHATNLHGLKSIYFFTGRQVALNHFHIFTSISGHHLLHNYSKDY